MAWLSLYSLSHADCLKLRLTDSYSVHRIVYSLFPPEINHGDRILYADKGFARGYRRILILSGHTPEAGEWGEIQTKTIPGQFLDFSSYNFEIIINPVRRVNSTGRIEPIKGKAEILAWFEHRAAGWGFAPLTLELWSVWADIFQKSVKSAVTLVKAKITGSLEVRDRELFKRSFYTGLGRGKAFGCGLLQLSPI